MSFEEIAKKLGISRARVHQIYISAIKKLSHPRNKNKWMAIFETLDLIKEQQAKKGNLEQGEKK
ncbi:TPA: RNA polymerase subunit sigma-70 [Campylobacter jejuni]|nr:RNA polymerase subunit sigma-70 [Campylobacter jejuni]HED5393479.1 RNA polymerase subunit sigma-70 [Campylobacter jejuni]HED5396563.1 RNA polymerase subunit sigma-70 [Campylobacter jejuni]